MNIVVLGATGKTGKEIVKQAIERGHQVTAFVRSPEKMTQTHTRLTVRAGDPRDEKQLTAVLPGHDAVLSALGHNDLKPSTLMADSARAATQAMKQANVRRILVESVAFLFPGGGLIRRVVRFILRNVGKDSVHMESALQNSGLDWTIVRPPRLIDGDDLNYRSVDGDLPPKGLTITRKAVAKAMLDILEAGSHIHQTVGVGH